MDPGSGEHIFTLVLTGIDELNAGAMDNLFAAGCDDATLSVRFGVVHATFARMAPSLGDAISSSVRDVERADIGVKVATCIMTRDQIGELAGLPNPDFGTE